MPDKFIVPEVVTREAYADLLEQLEALDAAARRILDAPKGTSHRQFRFWLMDALGDSYPASSPEVSERVDVRPQGPPTGGNPSVGEARSETFDPANAPFSDDPAAPIIAEESNQRNDDEERFVLSA